MEHHADSSAQVCNIDMLRIDVFTVDLDQPIDNTVVNKIIHSVQAAQQARFTAAAGANKRSHSLLRNLQVDTIKSTLVFRIVKVQSRNIDAAL